MHHRHVNRRRVLSIIAGTGIAASCGIGNAETASANATYKWQGTALGADASMIFAGADQHTARRGLQIALDEIGRLEKIFSLYRQKSEISRLNKTGMLQSASMEMRELLDLSNKISNRCDGLFDPTVQAVLGAVARWIERHPQADHIPANLTERTRALIDFRRIRTVGDTVQLAPGQRITLNGIAQGFIADKVADLLRANGFENVLVNTGEHHAIGTKPNGSAFVAQLAHAQTRVELSNMSLAVSAPSQVKLLAGSTPFIHLINPVTGVNPHYWRQIAVRHRSAAIADGLSTALCNCDFETAKNVMRKFTGISAWFLSENGCEIFYQPG